MRLSVVSVLTACLLLVAGFAAAEDGTTAPSDPSTDGCAATANETCGPGPEPTPGPTPPPGPTSPPPGGPSHDPQAQECYKQANGNRSQAIACGDAYCARQPTDAWCDKWCQEHPDASACADRPAPPQPDGNTTAPSDEGKRDACIDHAGNASARAACVEAYCHAHPAVCKQACANHPDLPMCQAAPPCGPAGGPHRGNDTKALPCHPLPPRCAAGLVELKQGERPVNKTLVCGRPIGCPGQEAVNTSSPTGKSCRFGADGRHHVTFQVAQDRLGLVDYRLDGVQLLASLRLEGKGPFHVDTEPSLVEVTGANDTLRIHDSPTGLIEYQGDGGLDLQFPAGTVLSAEAHSVRVTFKDGSQALLISESGMASLGNDTYRFTDHVSFLSPHAEFPPPGPHGSDLAQPIQDGRVGAIIEVSGNRAKAANGTEVLTLSDMNVTVATPEKVTVASPLRVRVSSELAGGRTIVLHLNTSVLQSLDPASLELHYFDVSPHGGKSEVVFHRASSLDDILNPNDDVDPATGVGQPEYYVVQDEHGLQVLVSIPHFSEHEITVASTLVKVLHEPSVLIGLAGGLAVTGLLGLALFARRKDEA